MAAKKEKQGSGWQEASGIMLLAFCVLVVMSLASYDFKDISLLHYPANQPARNFIGPVGAWFSFVVLTMVGLGGFLLPVGLGVLGLLLVLKREGHLRSRALWMLVILFAVVCLLELQKELWEPLRVSMNLGSPGGVLGHVLARRLLIRLLGEIGAGILVAGAMIAGLIFLFQVQPVTLGQRLVAMGSGLFQKFQERKRAERDVRKEVEKEARSVARRRQRLEQALSKQIAADEKARARADRNAGPTEPAEDVVVEEPVEEPVEVTEGSEPLVTRIIRKAKKGRAPVEEDAASEPVGTPPPEAAVAYHLPPITLLDELPAAQARPGKGDFQASSELLKETLAEFGIDGEITNVERGPVVTRFEVLPAAGVRVERIASLSNNIALAMKAETVRVQAPIPGKGVVGIEVPNAKTAMVSLRELLESAAWRPDKMALPLGLGKDVGGREIVADLAEMPHMLVAGATGAGKTVCMNSILCGLLMSRTPEEMRLMLVDPKIVEFSSYNNLPHLVVPVITDAKKVGHGLRWAIDEMEKRYKLFARVGVRNIKAYNGRAIAKQGDLFGEDVAEEPQDAVPDLLPYIVIVVDELADLMLVAQAEVENHIARLAQLSRAVGIHMVIATQRPSVNVITGTIKANFPARVAFKVSQKVDSRTILDANGADKLLGRGDMLFLPPGSHKLIRAQGGLTSDQEVTRIVSFIKDQSGPAFESSIKEKLEKKTVDIPEGEDDELLETAVEIIRQTKRASTSSLQRRLRIGYTRAARLMDLLEERGLVGPPRGSDPREILIDLDGDIPQNVASDAEES